MKIIVLAGGKSQRIFPFVEKPLLEFCGKSLLWHQLENLVEAGGRDFLIIGSTNNHLDIQEEGEIFQEFVRNNSGIEILMDYATQIIDEGSAGALKSAEDKFGDKGVLIVSSNDILEISAYRGIMETVERNPGVSVVLGQQVKEYFPGGYLLINAKGELERFVEKPGASNEPSDMINIVAHYHPSGVDLMDYIYKTKPEKEDLYQAALHKMIEEGHRVLVARYGGKWQAIKYPWHIYDAAMALLEKELKINRKEETGLQLIKEEGVRIEDGAILEGMVYLGKDVVVETGAVIRDSMVGEGSVIKGNAEIINSYLAGENMVNGNQIKNCIIGRGVTFENHAICEDQYETLENIRVRIKDQAVDTGRLRLGALIGDQVIVKEGALIKPGVKISCKMTVEKGVLSSDLEE